MQKTEATTHPTLLKPPHPPAPCTYPTPRKQKRRPFCRHVTFSRSNTVQTPLECNINVNQMLHFVFEIAHPIFPSKSPLQHLFIATYKQIPPTSIFSHFVLSPIHSSVLVACQNQEVI